MGNHQSGTRSSAKTHIALLGDSTIDNGRWVPRGEPSVFDQVGLASHWVMLRTLMRGWIVMDIDGLWLIYKLYISHWGWILMDQWSKLDEWSHRCSSWSRTSRCVRETELWYLALTWRQPGHSDVAQTWPRCNWGFNRSSSCKGVWLLQAICISICHVWYCCMQQKTTPGMGRSRSCAETRTTR